MSLSGYLAVFVLISGALAGCELKFKLSSQCRSLIRAASGHVCRGKVQASAAGRQRHLAAVMGTVSSNPNRDH